MRRLRTLPLLRSKSHAGDRVPPPQSLSAVPRTLTRTRPGAGPCHKWQGPGPVPRRPIKGHPPGPAGARRSLPQALYGSRAMLGSPPGAGPGGWRQRRPPALFSRRPHCGGAARARPSRRPASAYFYFAAVVRAPAALPPLGGPGPGLDFSAGSLFGRPCFARPCPLGSASAPFAAFGVASLRRAFGPVARCGVGGRRVPRGLSLIPAAPPGPGLRGPACGPGHIAACSARGLWARSRWRSADRYAPLGASRTHGARKLIRMKELRCKSRPGAIY